MKLFKLIFSLLFIIGLLTGCGSNSGKSIRNPLDILDQELINVPIYTIILFDMEIKGSIFKTYRHQYKVISEVDEQVSNEITEWFEVSKQFFRLNEKNMGMELASKKDGGVSKSVSPAGYSNYIGNSRYGEWRSHSGGSFWSFYGRYAMFNAMFNVFSNPARRSYYNDYRSNYSNTSRSYFGPKTASGRNYYGTYSDNTMKSRKNSSRWVKSSSFANKMYSGGNKSTRSGSRYNSSSSYRSRSGGFGK